MTAPRLRPAIHTDLPRIHEVPHGTAENRLTGYVWALFVIDEAQGRGHGTALLDAAMERLREAGYRQAFLSTGRGMKAEKFYRFKGWQPMGVNMNEETMFRLWL